MNKVILRGNLARDPEVKILDINGKKVTVTNFTVAVSRFFRKASGERDKDTTFVACEAWDSGAETIGKYFTKGDPILLEGSLKVESWEKDGQKVSRTKVRVSNFDRLYRAPVREGSQEAEAEIAHVSPDENF
jgi:single-strand DNA-binding protein